MSELIFLETTLVGNTNKIQIESPSKIILSGEDAVVFGSTSVACAVALMNKCTLRFWLHPSYRISIGSQVLDTTTQKCIKKYNKMRTLCDSAQTDEVRILLETEPLIWLEVVLGMQMNKGLIPPFFEIDIDLALPLGSGIGGSTVTSYLLAKAAMRALDIDLSAADIYNIVLIGDIIAHGGSASGTDSATIIYGGFRAYQNDIGHWPINTKHKLHFLLCDSGRTKRTSQSLGCFRSLQLESPDKFRKIISSIDKISRQQIKLLQAGVFPDKIGQLMNISQYLMVEAGVSTPEIEKIVKTALENGALGAKLTGGGCGGYVLILSTYENIENLQKQLTFSEQCCLATETFFKE